MKILDLSTDVLAIKCIKNYVFVGIGCTLYIINRTDLKVKSKIDALHPDNIHEIFLKSNNKLIVYGRKSLCLFHFDITDDSVSIEKLDEIHRFDDWIITLNWLGPTSDLTLTILFAHNNVYQYNLRTKQFSNTICRETCLLYAGTVSGENYENAVVFSGTVFQEVLIWKIKANINIEYSEVLHRLKGHKGVIFSVFYSPENNMICSTSDDRTVRLWKVSSNLPSDQKTVDWENVKISLDLTMYGHLARVWKAILFKNMIASIGEDSRICFWNFSGELLNKIEAHQGAPIWCIGVSEDDNVFTGGADGSVNAWPATSIRSHMQSNILLENDKDIIPKHVTFLDNCEVLAYSYFVNSCKLLHFSRNDCQLINSYDLPEYSNSYCIMELSLDRQKLALASIRGDITLYKKLENTWTQIGSYKVVDSRIFSLQWLDTNTVLICAEQGILYVVELLDQGIKIKFEHLLPSSRERWVTAACTYNYLLICGDRMGSIFVYVLQDNSKDPVQTFRKIHGRLGVQSCTIMNSTLVTTGRDGTLRSYEFCDIDSDNPSIEFSYARSMPMDWVSRLLKIKNDYYVLGFKEEDFVIYSILLKRIIVKFPCGGGHRSWDCMINNNSINFVYIQKKKIHLIGVPLNSLFLPPLLTGFHTKEIYCVKVLPIHSKHRILLSGGEDCTLNLNYIDSSTSMPEPNLKTIDKFDGHLSSIRCISEFTAVSNMNFSKHLIFSGGGRAQLKIWEITVKSHENNFSKDNVSCKDLLSHMLHGPDQERNKIWIGKELMYNADPETRYMDLSTMRNPKNVDNILIFVACSDGFLRTMSYNIPSNEIKLMNTVAYRNKCILKIHSFVHQDKILLITMATDGYLNFWNVLVTEEDMNIQKIEIDGKEGFILHQSGINSFDIKSLNNHKFILATGGDDNLLSLLVFRVNIKHHNVSIQTLSIWKTAEVHYAQITGVKLLDENRIFSVGADQKLVEHNYSYNDSTIDLTFLEENTLCISDIQGLTFFDNQKDTADLFCVYGKGFQLLKN